MITEDEAHHDTHKLPTEKEMHHSVCQNKRCRIWVEGLQGPLANNGCSTGGDIRTLGFYWCVTDKLPHLFCVALKWVWLYYQSFLVQMTFPASAPQCVPLHLVFLSSVLKIDRHTEMYSH